MSAVHTGSPACGPKRTKYICPRLCPAGPPRGPASSGSRRYCCDRYTLSCDAAGTATKQAAPRSKMPASDRASRYLSSTAVCLASPQSHTRR